MMGRLFGIPCTIWLASALRASLQIRSLASLTSLSASYTIQSTIVDYKCTGSIVVNPFEDDHTHSIHCVVSTISAPKRTDLTAFHTDHTGYLPCPDVNEVVISSTGKAINIPRCKFPDTVGNQGLCATRASHHISLWTMIDVDQLSQMSTETYPASTKGLTMTHLMTVADLVGRFREIDSIPRKHHQPDHPC